MASYISALPAAAQVDPFPRSLVILGSTGSIGTSALDVVAEHPEHYEILALAGARNTALLAKQADRFRPPYLAVLDAERATDLRGLLPVGYTPEIVYGPEGYKALATLAEAQCVLAAQVGAAGLRPTLAATRAGKIVALANKEALILAGHLFREAAAASDAVILPVDSEHNAIFQALAGHGALGTDDKSETPAHTVRRILLTASGGPFRGKDAAFLAQVTPAQALKHPNWSMGAKISIDSATLMNKGLEVIEAHHLYGVPLEQIEVVVHPQSIVHSLVEYEDRSQLAHLGPPDMRIAIAYCLAWPARLPLDMEPLDLARVGHLTFEKPDLHLFPCLRLAMDALRAGGGHSVALNAANEVAVDAFLRGNIAFMDIPACIEDALEYCPSCTGDGPPATLEAILDLDAAARRRAEKWMASRNAKQ